MARAVTAIVAALATLTVLVVTGAMNGIDQWGADHVMPALDPTVHDHGLVQPVGLWRPFAFHIAWWKKLLDVYTYPASVLPTVLIIALALVVILRRGERWPALVWAGAWCVVNAFEVAGKHELSRPDLYWGNGVRPIHVRPFDSSFPSGHTARAVMLAAIAAYAWPRARVALAAWLAFVPVALVVDAAHTITDVVGGLLLALLAVLLAHAMIAGWRWTQWRESWRGSSAARWPTHSQSSPTSPAKTSSSPPAS